MTTETVRAKATRNLKNLTETVIENLNDARKDENEALVFALETILRGLNQAPQHTDSNGNLNITLNLK